MTGPRRPVPPGTARRRGDRAVPILIVDDHALLGTALTRGLRDEGLPADYCDVPAIERIAADTAGTAPGLVLLDLDLGRDAAGNRIDGIDLIGPLQSAGWRILILSGSTDHGRVGAALDAGALAWVPKHAPFPVLLRVVRDAACGREVMSAARRQQFIDVHRTRLAEAEELAGKLGRLTQREREVLAELARGRRAQAVADRFHVSLATVRTQIRAVLTKLDVGSQLEAVAIFREAHRR